MHRHDGQFFALIGAFIVHHQRYVFQKIAQCFIFFHGAGKFGNVFQPACAFG